METSEGCVIGFVYLVYKSYPRLGDGNMYTVTQSDFIIQVYKSYPHLGDGNCVLVLSGLVSTLQVYKSLPRLGDGNNNIQSLQSAIFKNGLQKLTPIRGRKPAP